MFIIILLLLSTCNFSQELEFLNEDITFRLEQEYFSVEGYYWFLNSSPDKIEKTIFYPFPAGGNVDQTDVLNISASSHQNLISKSKHGFYFNINIAPGDTVLYRIAYRQNLTADSAVYILRSTNNWNKPLQQAEYKLIVDKKIIITDFSYHPDKNYNIEDKNIYTWKMNNFMPGKDMVFHFVKK